MFLNKTVLFLSALSIVSAHATNISFENTSNQEKVESIKVPANMVAVVHFQALNGKKLTQTELQERLLKAIIADNADEVKMLAAMGADIEYEYAAFNDHNFKATPLNIAARFGCIYVFKVLLELGLTVSENFQVIYRFTDRYQKEAYAGLIEIVKTVPSFKKQALPDICNGICNGLWDYHDGNGVFDVDMLREYLKKCQSAGITIHELWSAIYSFGLCPQYPVLKVFLEQGANPNLIVQEFHDHTFTPLTRAIYCPKECVQVLLDYGANVNLPINRGNNITLSPLQFAFQGGCSDKIELLLERGANWEQ